MRRLSLLLIAVALSVVGFAGAAHAASFAWSSADAGASIRQTPTDGDMDGDTVIDSMDACPTTPAYSRDGCGTWHVNGRVELGEAVWIYGTCRDGTDNEFCKPRGTASVRLTQYAKRKLGVKSALVYRGDFERPCGRGLFCAVLEPGSALKKKVKAFMEVHHSTVYMSATLAVEMTFPHSTSDTLSRKIRVGVHTNGGRFDLDSSNTIDF